MDSCGKLQILGYWDSHGWVWDIRKAYNVSLPELTPLVKPIINPCFIYWASKLPLCIATCSFTTLGNKLQTTKSITIYFYLELKRLPCRKKDYHTLLVCLLFFCFFESIFIETKLPWTSHFKCTVVFLNYY